MSVFPAKCSLEDFLLISTKVCTFAQLTFASALLYHGTEEITASFRRFGPLVVDWPHKAESKSYFPPKGYAFLLFQDESSVQSLIDACINEDDKLYLCVSSPTIKDKPVCTWNGGEHPDLILAYQGANPTLEIE